MLPLLWLPLCMVCLLMGAGEEPEETMGLRLRRDSSWSSMAALLARIAASARSISSMSRWRVAISPLGG